ncbi:hypothetical protein SAY87_006642 [Trapa incisa]|uniref:DUF761 domain-containing protein n=1 Tax=Trapa incisa TaxID=236973 RepID=A0AAN7Q490_9MYRT|nr:hypothetical protein SAY87_006642 [Trapa incisa]
MEALPSPDLKTPTVIPITSNVVKLPIPSNNGKKKRSAMGIFRAAMFMWRRRTSRKRSKVAATLQTESPVASGDLLNKVVGYMRPLHATGGESPLHLAADIAAVHPPLPKAAETLMLTSASPSPSELYDDVASSSDEGTSQYASALNLQELAMKADSGDDMIDVKAEEFIARFYQQMRIQNHQEMVHRSADGI